MLQDHVEFFEENYSVKLLPKTVEKGKKIAKIAKEYKMFHLVSHSGVKWYVTTNLSDFENFKNAVRNLE